MKQTCHGGAITLLIAIIGLIQAGCKSPDDGHHHYHPEVSVPDGHDIAFSLFAKGVQIYTWTGTNWTLKAPEAELYDAQGKLAGKHSKGADGPFWEAKDGSKVVGKLLTKADAYNSNSIPHLLLQAVSSSAKGTFSKITYIQRVDTVDGIPPANPGTQVGEEARVNYRAEYVFYRKAR